MKDYACGLYAAQQRGIEQGLEHKNSHNPKLHKVSEVIFFLPVSIFGAQKSFFL